MKVVPGFLALIGLAGVLAACAGHGRVPAAVSPEHKEEIAGILAEVYKKSTDTYLYEARIDEIALAGLSDLSRMHGPFGVEAGEKSVTVTFFTEHLYTFDRPAPMDAEGWAGEIAESMIALEGRTGTPKVPPRRLFELQMEGLAKGLGPDVEFISDQAVWDWIRHGLGGGVFFTFRRVDAGLEVLTLDAEGRLEAEGLRPGDIVTAIDNADAAAMKPFKLVQYLSGPEGSKVTFSVLRDDASQPATMKFTRWKPSPVTQELSRRADIAAFKLPALYAGMNYQFWEALRYEFRKAKFADLPLRALLVDLRGTLGSDIEAAAGFSEMFLAKGIKFTQRGRDPSSEKVWKPNVRDDSEALPLVILVDGMTGGAAELAAAALQDNDRALVIGSSTAGPGVIYDAVSVDDVGTLSMPATRAFAPLGYGLEKRGVMPQICVARPGLTLEAVLADLRRGEGLVSWADRTRSIAPDDEAALQAYRALCPLQPDPMSFDPRRTPANGDVDLAYELGLAILEDLALYERLMRSSPSS